MIVQNRHSYKGYIYKIEKAPQVVLDVLKQEGWTAWEEGFHSEDQWNLSWKNQRHKPSEYRAGKSYQKFNHFPKTADLGMKDHLCRMLKKMRNIHGRIFNFSPLTFILPSDYSKFIEAFMSKENTHPWICKPSGSSCGKGVYLLRDISELKYSSQCVIQKYLSDPYLIGGYKWDMRVYVLMTSVQPLKLYIYEEGICRFSTEKFDMDSLGNKFSHLTNTSINKYGANIHDKRDVVGVGNWTFAQLSQYLESKGVNWKTLWFKIRQIVMCTLINCPSVVPNLDCCFELFGFDIIVDQKHKPWLLEVNSYPALGVNNELDT